MTCQAKKQQCKSTSGFQLLRVLEMWSILNGCFLHRHIRRKAEGQRSHFMLLQCVAQSPDADLLKQQECPVTHQALGLQLTIRASISINSQGLSIHCPATPEQQQQPLGDPSSLTHFAGRLFA